MYIYEVLKNQTFELMLPLDKKAVDFCSSSELFQDPHFLPLYMTAERFDNFSLMADKIQVRSTEVFSYKYSEISLRHTSHTATPR